MVGMDLQEVEGEQKRPRYFRNISLVIVGLFLFVGYFLGVIFPPRPTGPEPIIVKKGMNAETIGDVLKKQRVIRSKIFFVWATYLGNRHDRLREGKFIFREPVSTFEVIRRLTAAQNEVTILIPEGMTRNDIADIFASKDIFSRNLFLEASQQVGSYDFAYAGAVPTGRNLEGFLFPDTYRFYDSVDPTDVVKTMLDNFSRKIKPSIPEIQEQDKTLYEIVTMASILEKEVKTKADKELVAGILWKRLEQGMLLQVDAALTYETGKTSAELSTSDLQHESPYNTYLHKGLPPGPVSNPGVESIEAAVFPKSSAYYFYLSDGNGTTHFAKTFDEHKLNKVKYLK